MNYCLKEGIKINNSGEYKNSIKSLVKCFSGLVKEPSTVLVCAEYTGKYIYPLACACKTTGLDLWIEDPMRIKHSFGIARGKNDTVDAERIAEYAFRFQDKSVLYQLPDKAFASLQILLTDRELMRTDRQKYEAQLKDQKDYMDQEDYRRKSTRLGKLVDSLKAQIMEIDEEIATVVDSNPMISHQVELLKTIDGIGDKTAVRIVALTGGFSKFQNARQFNCYAGLAPFFYTSGKSIHSKARISQRANKNIKALLHLAALSAATHMKESEYKIYYERKCREGKHPMSGLNVVRAKLVARMFAVIRSDKPYRREHEKEFIQRSGNALAARGCTSTPDERKKGMKCWIYHKNRYDFILYRQERFQNEIQTITYLLLPILQHQPQ